MGLRTKYDDREENIPKTQIYVSIDLSSSLLKIDPSGQTSTINMGAGANHMIVNDSIYSF